MTPMTLTFQAISPVYSADYLGFLLLQFQLWHNAHNKNLPIYIMIGLTCQSFAAYMLLSPYILAGLWAKGGGHVL